MDGSLISAIGYTTVDTGGLTVGVYARLGTPRLPLGRSVSSA